MAPLYNTLLSIILRVRIPIRRGVLDTTLCDKVYRLVVSSTNKTNRHDNSEILLKVALNTITITLNLSIKESLIPPSVNSAYNINLYTKGYYS